ncbi:hypothetical protein DLM75_13045 [Leptospira stimsonii]|uniref:Uncharacterized protein n=1 Tax=Leptospira stimsonii TaxID=2202203 RepID=A0A396Z554_9LEPT|nr:hypothetical protein DLM75_13045 [Leptospira stimsonii]
MTSSFLKHTTIDSLPLGGSSSAEDLFPENTTVCSGCGVQPTIIYQFDLCKPCLKKWFEKLRPLLDSVRK